MSRPADRMVTVVIESPYAGDVERNVAYARACVRDSLSRGEAPFASHLIYTQPGVYDDNVPAQRARGIEAGLAYHRVCDRVVFYMDLGWSRGMLAAHEAAFAAGRVLEYRLLRSHDHDRGR